MDQSASDARSTAASATRARLPAAPSARRSPARARGAVGWPHRRSPQQEELRRRSSHEQTGVAGVGAAPLPTAGAEFRREIRANCGGGQRCGSL